MDQAPLLVLAANEADPTRARNLTQRGVRVLRANGLEWELRALRDAGVRSMFVEGGAGLAGALLNGHAVDWMYLFHAPLLLGSGLAGLTGLAPVGIDQATRWRRVATQVFGSDTLITLAAR